MQAVVLAAGKGTRLRPLTEDTPKGLVDIAGEPILTHCFERLQSLAVDEIIVVVGYRGDTIVEYYGDSYGEIPITYVWQDERKGLAHALLTARNNVTDTFVEVHGDYLFGQPLTPVVEHHTTTNATATLLVDEVSYEDATEFGVCEFDANGVLVGLEEKPAEPASKVVITGCFVFEPAIFPACQVIQPSERGEYELTDAIDLLVYADHSVETVPGDTWLVNVNTPADRDRAEQLLAEE